ncbi:MAG: autotransporter assembly complex family protein [Thiotrichales bacterium]
MRWIALFLVSFVPQAFAAEESPTTAKQPPELESDRAGKVRVTVNGIEGPLLENVLGHLEIQQLASETAPSPARVRYLHRAAEQQITQALQAHGHFRPRIESELLRTATDWDARYQINAGPVIPIGTLDIKVTGAGEADPEFRRALAETPLKRGDALDQVAYEALKRRFQVLASERGYFNAQLTAHEIKIDLAAYSSSVRLHFETGQRYQLGDVSFWQEREWLAPSMLERYVEIEPGQPYDAGDLQQLQGDLSNTEYFRQVEINASPESALDLIIPVEVRLFPTKPRKYTYGIGYGTDTGPRVKAGITGRRVNRWGHHYNAEALIAQIKYGVAGEYIIPGRDPRSDAYGLRASLEEEHSDTRDYRAFNIGGYYKYRDGLWVKTWALDYRVEQFEIGARTPTSALLIPSVEWTRTIPGELEDRIYAVNGAWLQLRLRGAYESLLSDTSFLQPLVAAKWIHSFDHRGRLIGRAALGTTWVDDFDALPVSLRYFTGGDRSVRGYKYEIIAPRDEIGQPVGGKHLGEASLEYEFPVKDKWSVAAFIDTGDAFNDEPELKTGIGIGLRWRSPIGPVRIDLGHGLDQPPGSDLRLHLTIGPDL